MLCACVWCLILCCRNVYGTWRSMTFAFLNGIKSKFLSQFFSLIFDAQDCSLGLFLSFCRSRASCLWAMAFCCNHIRPRYSFCIFTMSVARQDTRTWEAIDFRGCLASILRLGSAGAIRNYKMQLISLHRVIKWGHFSFLPIKCNLCLSSLIVNAQRSINSITYGNGATFLFFIKLYRQKSSFVLFIESVFLNLQCRIISVLELFEKLLFAVFSFLPVDVYEAFFGAHEVCLVVLDALKSSVLLLWWFRIGPKAWILVLWCIAIGVFCAGDIRCSYAGKSFVYWASFNKVKGVARFVSKIKAHLSCVTLHGSLFEVFLRQKAFLPCMWNSLLFGALIVDLQILEVLWHQGWVFVHTVIAIGWNWKQASGLTVVCYALKLAYLSAEMGFFYVLAIVGALENWAVYLWGH